MRTLWKESCILGNQYPISQYCLQHVLDILDDRARILDMFVSFEVQVEGGTVNQRYTELHSSMSENFESDSRVVAMWFRN